MKSVEHRWIYALLAPALALALALPLAGCGTSAPSRTPGLTTLPLTAGARIVAQTRRCDRGADPYCAVQLVVESAGYSSSGALMTGERRHLDSLGWSHGNGDTGHELAAESPGQRLRLIYGTAAADLQAIDLGYIRRSPRIAMALSRAMFDRATAISLMLETGSA